MCSYYCVDVKFKRIEEFFFRKDVIFCVNETIERKYSEFLQLWELLERIYPSQVIPPLPETLKDDPLIFENQINLALEALHDHPILREDEYFKTFLEVAKYAELVPMIKNVEAPVQTKREYFKRGWGIINKGSNGMSKDDQYQKVKDNTHDSL